MIKEDQPIIGQILRIRQLSHGDESERSLAVDRIRVACEMIMREACLNQNISIKPKASVADMLKQFRKLPDVSAKRANILQDTIYWSDPSHHTDQTWTVPTTTQIVPHISRLESFINDLKL